MSFFSNAAKDAKKIHNQIDYRVLKAAWYGYTEINVRSFTRTFKVPTPSWFALFAVQNYNGRFDKFTIDELHLLKALTNVHKAYDEIIEALESNSSDEELARHILENYPELKEALPPKYERISDIISYIVGVIKHYEILLDEFYKKYKKKIESAIEELSVRAENESNQKIIRGNSDLSA